MTPEQLVRSIIDCPDYNTRVIYNGPATEKINIVIIDYACLDDDGWQVRELYSSHDDFNNPVTRGNGTDGVEVLKPQLQAFVDILQYEHNDYIDDCFCLAGNDNFDLLNDMTK